MLHWICRVSHTTPSLYTLLLSLSHSLSLTSTCLQRSRTEFATIKLALLLIREFHSDSLGWSSCSTMMVIISQAASGHYWNRGNTFHHHHHYHHHLSSLSSDNCASSSSPLYSGVRRYLRVWLLVIPDTGWAGVISHLGLYFNWQSEILEILEDHHTELLPSPGSMRLWPGWNAWELLLVWGARGTLDPSTHNRSSSLQIRRRWCCSAPQRWVTDQIEMSCCFISRQDTGCR